MKTRTHFILVSTLVATFCLSGCTSSSVEPVSSKTDLLTGTSWQLQKALALGPAAGQTTDVTSQFSYLTMYFTRDGKYSTPVHSGTWQFADNESSILFDKDSLSQFTGTLVELSSSVLHFTIPTATSVMPQPMDLSFVPQQTGVNSPIANFDTLWAEFDAHYSHFEVTGVSWDSLRAIYRPQITGQTSDQQLFQIMSSMLAPLKDGHVNLMTTVGTFSYSGWWTPYPTNYLGSGAVTKYLSTDYGYSTGNLIRYGKTSDNIGYLYVGTLAFGDANSWASAIDVAIDSLKNTKGIVLDLRNNGGGNDSFGNIVAGRFADASHVYSYVRWRNGPRHSDFTDYQAATVQPQGPRQFTKRVTVLTNRHCFSSAEATILMMKAFPHVITVGDTSGGGSGNPAILQLPNKWSYWVPRWIQYTADKKMYEGIGLAPDIPIWISSADISAGRDAILERAIQYLKQ